MTLRRCCNWQQGNMYKCIRLHFAFLYAFYIFSNCFVLISRIFQGKMSYLRAGLENEQLRTQREVVSVAPGMHTEVLLPFSTFPEALAPLCLARTENLREKGLCCSELNTR